MWNPFNRNKGSAAPAPAPASNSESKNPDGGEIEATTQQAAKPPEDALHRDIESGIDDRSAADDAKQNDRTDNNDDSKPAETKRTKKNESANEGKTDEGKKPESKVDTGKKLENDIPRIGPMNKLDDIRTDPIRFARERRARLERVTAEKMPEIHFVGQIASGQGLLIEASEGAYCRWKVDYGKAWDHLGGELLGQTQIAYCRTLESEMLTFNHPLDLHFALAGLQGWGAPRISMQCFRLDFHGRRLLSGYGFAHLPTTPGFHRVEVSMWRPVGTPWQELEAFLIGRTPALSGQNGEPIYESAWRDRCRLVTVSAGKVFMELFVSARNLKEQGVDVNTYASASAVTIKQQ